MQLAHVDDIVVPEYRIRRDFDPDKIVELMTSIESKGLLHALVVRKDGKTLVAGERRFRAIKDIHFTGGHFSYNGIQVPKNMVPIVLLEDLSPLDHEEAELEENIKRQDLTWQEECAATARITDLRKRQAEAQGLSPPSLREIAVSLDLAEGNAGYISEKLAVSRHLEDKDVAGAKNVRDALKIVKKKQQEKRNTDLAHLVGQTFSASSHQLINIDSLIWMKECPDSQFDVILTDPLYGMGADEFGDSGGLAAGAHGYKDDLENFLEIMKILPYEAFRVAKPQAHLYCFCDIDWFIQLRNEFRFAGWKVFRTPLIWHKPNGQRTPWVNMGPQRKYECILFAVKGSKLVQKIVGDVLTFPSDENLGHAAQKPVALFEELLKRSCVAGDKVLDPFMGTGPIFPAAHGLKVTAVGIEKDPAAYGIAVNRIKELK